MKIKEIETIPVAIPRRPFIDATTYLPSAELKAVVVKIRTTDGIEGVGECTASERYSGETQESIKYAIDRYLGPNIIGESPFDIEKIMYKVDKILFKNTFAKMAIDLALHDILGKALNVPLYCLIGGRYRNKVLVGVELSIADPKDMAREALEFVSKGIKVLKVKVGVDLKKDIERFVTVREAVGDDILLRADANQGYSRCEAIKFIRSVEKYGIEYMEQPIPWWDIDGLAYIRKAVNTPIQADESLYDIHDMLKLVKKEAVDIVNVKLGKHGGIHSAKKIIVIAESAGTTCSFGNMGELGFATAAKIHMACSTKSATYASEFTGICGITDRPSYEFLTTTSFEVKDGYLEVPEKPGLGVKPDEDKLELYKSKI